MELQLLKVFSPTTLIAIGVLLIAIEVFVFSFTIFWFGIAAIIVGLLSTIIVYDDGVWQIASISILALVLLVFLRTKAMKVFMKSKDKEINDNFLNTSGEGIIKDSKVYFKATYWNIESDLDTTSFSENDKVTVISTSKGKAKIKKIENN